MNGMVHVSGEVTMWRAVIQVALLDAIGIGPSASSATERWRLRDEARSWFRRADSDFRTVCELALLDPGAVRTMALRLFGDDGAKLSRIRVRRRRMEWRAARQLDRREVVHG